MNFKNEIQIGEFNISQGERVFIIAEAGVNHNGDITKAKKMIDIAYEAGVDAIKFQAFKTDSLIIKNVKKAEYQIKSTGQVETQYEMLKKLELTKEENLTLVKYCKEKGIMFLTTPFDENSLDELDEFDLPAYKVASTDITNLPFLIKIAKKGKPILLSTGMTYNDEIEKVLNVISEYTDEIVLLQCTASYPMKDEDANLKVIPKFIEKYGILVGYSDHSIGIGAAPYAIPLGACMIEKHFTLDRTADGPDHRASLTPEELKEFVLTIRKAETFMGTSVKIPTLNEMNTRKSLQKSLVLVKDISKGSILSEDDIVAKRTGGEGISPLYYEQVIGKIINKNLKKDEILDV